MKKPMLQAILGLVVGLHTGFNALAIEPDYSIVIPDRRDPFAIAHISNCQKRVTEEGAMLSKWQLRGIIGQKSNLRGWIQFPTGEWLKVFSKIKLPLVYWKLSEINSGIVIFSPQLISEVSCNPTKIIELKIRK